MPAHRDFALPDLGEGLTEGEILRWLVAPGETITLNQPIVEVETAKAAVEVPSPYAGTVVRLHHGEGDTVDVGAPIITVDTAPDASASDLVPDLGRTAVLVGYGPRSGSPTRRPRRPREDRNLPADDDRAPDDRAHDDRAPGDRAVGDRAVGDAPGAPEKDPGAPEKAAGAPDEPREPDRRAPLPPARVSAAGVAEQASRLVAAKPPVRKFARDRGIDLASITGSGPQGSITRGDVQARLDAGATAGAGESLTGGREERIPVRGVRRLTAQNMVASAFSAPHVTEFLTVDATATVELLGRLRDYPEFSGVRVSPLTVLARALVLAIARHPEINSTWDEAAQEIVVKHYVNLGIAAATPRGLLVPVIKGAERMSLPELAGALTRLAATAREGRTAPADLAGGTVTITNVGVFGVDTGTPILNPGESAIVCLGAIRDLPWVHEGALAVRKVTTLALSFDHRVVDGALGSAVLADLGAALADPTRLLAWS